MVLGIAKYCQLPGSSGAFETALGHEVNINTTIADLAIQNADDDGKVSIMVFRNNCLVASSPRSATVDSLRKNIFSATKGVISMITGIAYDQGKLQLDDPIGLYLPDGPGWGDSIARNITIRQLLTETAGMKKGVVAEGITVHVDQSIPQEALAQTIIYPPGTEFQYSQRVPDLLAYVVGRAVGQDFQTFAQTYLFGPIGIPGDSYIWFRDRSGNTYGYAYLYLSSTSFARLGLVMQNGGMWNNQRIISASYVSAVSEPSDTNGCYGLLFWTNKGSTCISPTGYLFNRTWMPSAPPDLFAMSGSPQQKNYIIPSLNITVSWTGVLTDSAPSVDTWYKFFLTLMPGVMGMEPFVPGPFTFEPFNISVVLEALDPNVFLQDVISSPECNIVICNKTVPVIGLLQNIISVVGFGAYAFLAILGG